jgi:Protein of unknown function (DUF3866)
MLKLRRGVVVEVDPLVVEVEGERRRAWADTGLVGETRSGDEVVVNVEAQDLGLGSGGFDVVHVNLTRGLAAEGPADRHVMKLNYTSLQHAVEPVEGPDESGRADESRPPIVVIPLHGHLAPVAWAAHGANRGLKIGYVQTHGGALPGAMSRDVAELRDRGLIAGHVTAGAAYGAEHDAISLVGGLDAAASALGWDAVIAGPGPGILGSSTRYGHGGMAALDTAHAALALGSPTLVGPRLSNADPRERHVGLSHHTRSVLELLLAPVRVPVPEVDADLWPTTEAGPGAYDELLEVCRDRHDLAVEEVDLDGYAASGLPTRTMGRELADDALFFAAPLAAGRALANATDG